MPSDIRHLISHIQNQHLTSEIRHPTSDIRHLSPDIGHSTSDIRDSTSDIRHPRFDIRHPTFDIRHSTYDIRHTTSDIWKYDQDVQCLGSSDLRGEVWKETMRTILVFFYIFIILHCRECVLPRYAPFNPLSSECFSHNLYQNNFLNGGKASNIFINTAFSAIWNTFEAREGVCVWDAGGGGCSSRNVYFILRKVATKTFQT